MLTVAVRYPGLPAIVPTHFAGMAVTFFGIVLAVTGGADAGSTGARAGPVLIGAGLVGMVVTCAVGIVRMLR